MTAACPHCGGALPGPSVHRGELERQLGDPARAQRLRERARSMPSLWTGIRLDDQFIAYRGYVWTRCRVRKPTKCCISAEEVPAGGFAYRQLSEVRDRDLRVHAGCWDGNLL